ncbi:MAG: type II toxin-antitoxin system RelE/ParE family toxin [Magnetococcus sp. YQC-5]
MSTLIFQPKFRRDVILAWHYIALDYRSRADEWLNTLHRALERLASQPKMG